MARRYLALILAAVVVASLFAAGALARRSATPKLVGTVGPGFTITLKQNNKVVKTLQAGTYTLVINDKASIHAFSLDGPHGFAPGARTVRLRRNGQIHRRPPSAWLRRRCAGRSGSAPARRAC